MPNDRIGPSFARKKAESLRLVADLASGGKPLTEQPATIHDKPVTIDYYNAKNQAPKRILYADIIVSVFMLVAGVAFTLLTIYFIAIGESNRDAWVFIVMYAFAAIVFITVGIRAVRSGMVYRSPSDL